MSALPAIVSAPVTVVPRRCFPLLASVLGRRYGVNVRFAQVRTACTDGRTITLPILPDMAPAEHEDLIIGLLDHEICHVRRSDFSLLDSKMSPLVHCLWNTFEDIWIERVHARLFPGAFENIRKSVILLQKMDPTWYGPLSIAAEGRTLGPADLLMSWMLRWTCGMHYNLPVFVRNSETFRDPLEALVGADLIDQIESVASRCLTPVVESTQAAFALANEVLDLLKTELDEERKKAEKQSTEQAQQKEQQQGPSPDEQQGQQQGQQPAPQPSGQSTQASQASGTPSASSAPGASGASGGVATGGTLAAGDQNGLTTESSVAQAIAAMLTAGKYDLPEADLGAKIGIQLAAVADPNASYSVQSILNDAPDKGSASGIQKAVIKEATADPVVQFLVRNLRTGLGLRLESFLEAFSPQDSYFSTRGRKIANSRLAGLRTGKTAIFQRDTEVESIDTAMGFLLDLSGSMFMFDTSQLGLKPSGEHPRFSKYLWEHDPQGRQANTPYTYWVLCKLVEERSSVNGLDLPPATLASAVGFALGGAIERFDVPFSLSYFGDRAECVKDFDDSWRRCSTPWVRNFGGTALVEPAAMLGRAMAMRSEQRKLMLVATDGDPSNAQACAAVFKEIEAFGVEVVTLFIGDSGNDFEGYLLDVGLKVFRLQIHEMDKAPQVIFDALKHSMMQYRYGQ
jgi:hypothetical protein